ncbi:MAG: hypothetical protein JWL59_4864 [Chthoniobacteraceae bacterium]|nr:hypothetical protein [Chthoniobacteraceae bacterium]
MSNSSLSQEELVSIVQKLCAAEGSEDEMDEMLQSLHNAVPYAPWTDLIYWPSGFPHNPDIPELTPEEIVERALDAKANIIIIPPYQNDRQV